MKDTYLDKFRELSTPMAAYMRDVTCVLDHDIQSLSPGARVIGRAFTVKGPDIYLNALESIPDGSIYVHAEASDVLAAWSGSLAEIYGKPRGLIAAVIDGGVKGREEAARCEIPTFARFVTPIPAINRQEGIIQVPVVCGGAPVSPGDVVLGDADGVVVIPQCHEDELYKKMDGFLYGIEMFMKIARQPGVIVTKHEALAEMLALKYEHPYDYWRHYEPWSARWRKKYGSLASG